MCQAIFRRSFGYSVRLLAACVALLLAAARPAAACGGDDGCDAGGPGLVFGPELLKDPSAEPFIRAQATDIACAGGFYGMIEERQDSLRAANTDEWFAFLGGNVPKGDLDHLVYKMGLEELDGLVLALNGRKVALSARATLLHNELSKVESRAAVISALYYLGLAKRAEPIATWRSAFDDWEEKDNLTPAPEVLDSAAKILSRAQKFLRGVSEAFLDRRYRFQILRLLFYSEKFDECVRYYETHRVEFDKGGSLQYRAMDLAAGALYRQKQYGRANYLYSIIFDRYPPLKKSAFRSFHPQEEADWQQTLALAKGPRETQVLWQMFGIVADGVTAIEKIRAIEPGSDLLPLLLIREVNKAEGRALSSGWETAADKNAMPPVLLAAVKQAAAKGDAAQPRLWDIALAHLYAINGDKESARRCLDEVEVGKGDAPMDELVRKTRFLAKIRSLSVPDKGTEDYLATELAWLEDPTNGARDLYESALYVLSRGYGRAGDSVRSRMLVDKPEAEWYQDNAEVDKLIAFVRKRRKTPFDAFLTRHHGYSVDQLVQLQGLNHLYAGRFDKADELLRKIDPKSSNARLRADPFVINIRDCHECDLNKRPLKNAYTQASFVRRLHELSRKARGRQEEAAQASFELANGLYNMTNSGNRRDVYATAHGNFDSVYRGWDTAMAEKYYRRAIDLSSDREFKAKATFMAAKCEGGWDYDGSDRDGYSIPTSYSGKYYGLLKSSYSDTKYYAEILRECGYFRYWAEGVGR